MNAIIFPCIVLFVIGAVYGTVVGRRSRRWKAVADSARNKADQAGAREKLALTRAEQAEAAAAQWFQQAKRAEEVARAHDQAVQTLSGPIREMLARVSRIELASCERRRRFIVEVAMPGAALEAFAGQAPVLSYALVALVKDAQRALEQHEKAMAEKGQAPGGGA